MFVCACHDAADVSERFVATRRAALRLLTITSKFMAPSEGREAENRRTESNGPGTVPDVLVRAREQRRGAQNTRRKRAKNNNKKHSFFAVFSLNAGHGLVNAEKFFFSSNVTTRNLSQSNVTMLPLASLRPSAEGT